MSNKRHNHGIKGFNTNIGKAPVERDEQGNFLRQSSHVIGNGVYHPCKGFRKNQGVPSIYIVESNNEKFWS